MKKQIPGGLAPQQIQTEKKKVHLTQILRHVIQLIALILMPGLFITAFSALRDVWQAVLQGSFTLSGLSSQLLVLAAVFPVTVIWGRFFCGYLCSFGAMGDLMGWISSKIRKKPLQMPPKADRVLKFVKYGVLAFLVIAVWTLGMSIDTSVSPWNVFGVLVTLWKGGSVRSLASVGMLLLVLIFAGSLLVDRFFCRYLCPLGAVFALVSRIRLFRIFKKQPEACGSCRMCTIHCSMGISLNQTERVKDSECIECFRCVDVCPRSNMTSSAAPAIAGTAAAVAVGGIYFSGTYAAAGTAPAGQTAVSSEQGQYKDGTYTGSAQGYRGTTTVSVTVKNGNITDISIESTGDDAEFFNKAKNTVIQEILSEQTTKGVDTVSGATFSSNGILGAVADALQVDFDNPNDSSSGEFSHGHGGHGGGRSFEGDGGYSGYSARG